MTTNFDAQVARPGGCACGHRPADDQRRQDSGAEGGCCGSASHDMASDRDQTGCCGAHKATEQGPNHDNCHSDAGGNHS